jgi:hypothetical protein
MSAKRTYRLVPHELNTIASQLVDGWRDACQAAQSIATEYRTPVSIHDCTQEGTGAPRRTFLPQSEATTVWGDQIVTVGVTVAVSRARLESDYFGPASAREVALELLRVRLEPVRGSVTNWRGRHAVVLGIERGGE